MANNEIEKIHKGAMGFFWINDARIKKTKSKPERGFVRLGESGLLELTTLNEDPLGVRAHRDHPTPRSITGATEHGGILLLSFGNRGNRTAFGGAQASVYRYGARSVIAGIHPDHLRSERILELEIHFNSIGQWAGLSAVNEKFTTRDGGRLSAYSVELSSPPSLQSRLGPSLELVISGHWAVDGPSDQRVLHAPTALACVASRPRRIDDFRMVLAWMQGLLSVAYGGCLVADGGSATPDISGDRERLPYWDSRFMLPAEAAPKNS